MDGTIHRVTTVTEKQKYLTETECYVTMLYIMTKSGARYTLTMFGADSEEITWGQTDE